MSFFCREYSGDCNGADWVVFFCKSDSRLAHLQRLLLWSLVIGASRKKKRFGATLAF